MIVIAGTARVRPEHRTTALAAGSDMARRSAAEPGCTAYRIAVDIDDDCVIHLFEHWVGEQALQAHFATAHFADFTAAIVDAIDGEPSFLRYSVDGVGPLFA